MKSPDTKYEVEFRCHFADRGEAFEKIPFLARGLQGRCTWETAIYGPEYFKSGLLLRTAAVVDGKGPRYYIGWKGSDTGKFANIRQELDGEIGSASSQAILRYFGGKTNPGTLAEVSRELERLGYHRFMSFSGEDASGYYQPLDLHLKIMYCETLRWPLIVEIEKTAATLQEASQREEELFALSRELGLEERVVRDEPPTLLYQALFPEK